MRLERLLKLLCRRGNSNLVRTTCCTVLELLRERPGSFPDSSRHCGRTTADLRFAPASTQRTAVDNRAARQCLGSGRCHNNQQQSRRRYFVNDRQSADR